MRELPRASVGAGDCLRFRPNSARNPFGALAKRFLARFPRGSRSSASAPPIPRARTLGSRAAAKRGYLELAEMA